MPVWRRGRAKAAAVALASGSDTESDDEEDKRAYSSSASGFSRSGVSSQLGRQLPPRRPPRVASLAALGFGAASTSGLLLSAENEALRARAPPPTQFGRTQSNPVFASALWAPDSACNASFHGSQASVRRLLPRQRLNETMRVLIIGAPQVGKSSLVNSYRAAVTNNVKWPAAPVGICGFCGTTTVDPFPNHPTEPTWLCIDTPGRFYDAGSRQLLKKLCSGVPWKTRLAGNDALTPEELEKLPSVSENSAHQCIVVVPATDLIQDNGWMSVLFFASRYEAAPDAEGVIMNLQGLVSTLRSFLHDASPFVVISKMDLVGGAGSATARRAITSMLTRCIPVNRLYFCASPNDESSHEKKRLLTLDPDTRVSLIRLHEDLSLAFRWRKSLEEDA
ncbi:GTP-binding protein [Trypanosoma conorhini]|uniref:GTP-binding protein n=1 Tax=Trypanosoma conorhini TaxID=83891 RepID=A0A3R7NA68_9TRYP|nr:GTP-binding protein [Trypanosoma conorhini]RNF18937.1 GTP-binding protein [Trypanosoma conorhini]